MKRTVVLALCLILTVFLCGCNSWMDGNYYSVTPHPDDADQKANESTVIHSYEELQEAISDLISVGSTSGVIFYSGLEEASAERMMENAVRYIREDSPLGAYAVDSIRYELGSNTGRPAIALEITYHHGRSEILRIKDVEDLGGVKDVVAASLRKCEAGVVLHTSNYEEMDLIQFVEDYVWENADACMELPQVSVAQYPDSGDERIIEVVFVYQTSRDTLRSMQSTVKPIFDSATLYVSGDDDPWQKYGQLYSFLMERFQYKIETSITPTYSLLRHGVGDCKAFAAVYAAMCRNAGLECRMVSGTRDGEAWSWNAVKLDGEYYYIDLLRQSAKGGFTVFQEGSMEGYVWDYSAFDE